MTLLIERPLNVQTCPHGAAIRGPMNSSRCNATVLLIEHRDEVFARLAADVQGFGLAVHRARSAHDAACCCCRRKMDLIVGYRDLPDESGWLFASKLRAVDPLARIWLYAPAFTAFDRIGAEYSGIEDLMYYEGDLWRLSRQVTARLWHRTERLRRICGSVPEPSYT